jgi:hypothetical protein
VGQLHDGRRAGGDAEAVEGAAVERGPQASEPAAPSAGASAPSAEPATAPATTEPAQASADDETPIAPSTPPGGETPLESPPPLETAPVADLDPATAAGLAAALIAVLMVTVLVLRRGRSGVGL